MNSRRRWLLVALGGTAAAAGWRHWLGTGEPLPGGDAIDIRDVLATQDDARGFARAEQPWTFSFPRDHGPHGDFRSEWWYFTGHLDDTEGGAYGFQLTLFRFELAPPTDRKSVSAWRTPRVLLGHFAVSDISGGRFHAFERLSRALPGQAGASIDPPAVWLDDWRIDCEDDGGTTRFTLAAGQDGVRLTLTLTAQSPLVLQGENGLSRKSAAPGNASYYYSLPRLAAHGRLAVGGRERAVSGAAWLDREWSTSALDRSQVGWDWFALQFNDGSNLMFYRLREAAGQASVFSAGSHLAADGTLTRLAHDDVHIEALASWHSPDSGRTYPAAWRLAVPRLALVVELRPRLAAQEWHARFVYWEGATEVTRDGAPAGRAYVELTGY